jgi:hypothetical protein
MYGALAFDGRSVLQFGGTDPVTQQRTDTTYRYDGTAWTQLTPATAPPPLRDHEMAFDAARGRVVLVGPDPVAWEWDGSNWTRVANGPWGERRARFLLAFAPARGRVVFASGEANQVTRGDAFEWDGAAWHSLPPPGGRYLGGAGVALPGGDLVLVGERTVELLALRHQAPATITPLGAGCSGSAGRPGLDVPPWSRAWLGASLAGRVTGVPAATASVALALGARADQWNGLVLPFDLALLGAPGCPLRTGPDLFSAWPAAAGSATFAYPVPANAALLGGLVHLQAFVPDPAANAGGFTVSDAVTARIGAR